MAISFRNNKRTFHPVIRAHLNLETIKRPIAVRDESTLDSLDRQEILLHCNIAVWRALRQPCLMIDAFGMCRCSNLRRDDARSGARFS
jgi:hypothetical protein